ncbi:hypothetical protein [Paenibacillus mendelii]|uniref:Uncharacterized protein n=1 Tax=Paenibacillus mendelii TaxID=206163 RepID=A0ABV6JKN0_9BACL|nr:hypothetical protein [Paenibacillus mendelii]MCQ6557969.1 hypothetical protein [Paenibacillus mendelii]
MGEEKPDEELMGKRKSSPRLSTAPRDADMIRITGSPEKYTSKLKRTSFNFFRTVKDAFLMLDMQAHTGLSLK